MTNYTSVLTNNNKDHKRGSVYAGKPIADIVVNGFFTIDKSWAVGYWNRAAEKIMGVVAADIIGKNLWETLSSRIPPEFSTVRDNAFKDIVPNYFEEYWGELGDWFDVITYRCGDTLSVSFKSKMHSSYPDQPANLEQQLHIKTGLYQFLTEVSNDCLWEWDLVTKEIFWIYGGHKRVFGYPIENALIPQNFWENLIHPADRNRILAKINKIVLEKSATIWEVEYRFKKANGDYASMHDRGHIIYEEGENCRMIGATQDVTERVLLEKRLGYERMEREMDIINIAFSAQEKERSAVCKELLGNVNDILGAFKFYIETAKKDPINLEALLSNSCDYIVKVMESVRRIAKALDPPFLAIMGLIKSIKILTDDLASGYSVQFTINDSGLSLIDLDEKLQHDIFRIVQQQVNKILEYADASLASIDISRYDDEIVLFIVDNGNGCDLSERKAGSGIKNIINMVNLYKGSVTTLSAPGEGYTLHAIFKTG